MASGPKNKTKTKGKLAKALVGAQAAQAKRQAEERTAQGERDRQAAVAKKMRAGQGSNGQQQQQAAKRRKLNEGKGKERAEGGDEGEGEGEGGARESEERKVEKTAEEEKKKQGVQPFKKGERILLVGEGNFSFAHSLLLPLSQQSSTSSTPVLPLITPSLLLCTAFDSLQTCSQKYPDLSLHVSALREAGATVLFGVDATKLEENKSVREFAGLGKVRNRPGKGKGRELAGIEDGKGGFDKIVFNFPHIGQGITDQSRNIRQNQTLLLDFYRSASLLLRRGNPQAPGSSTSSSSSTAFVNTGAWSESAREVSRSPSPEPIGEEDAEDEEGKEKINDADDADLTLAPPSSSLYPPPTTRGTLLLTLRTTPPYSSWLPSQLATKPLLLYPSLLSPPELRARLLAHNGAEQPTYKVVRSWAFEPERWEGYEHRRTKGWEEGRVSGVNEDIRLTAKERAAKKFGAEGKGGGKEEKGGEKGGTGMRTWEFELWRWQDEKEGNSKGGKGGKGGKKGGKGKRKAREEDSDLSD
ncbi:hypothetical protein JCM8547_003313 [Rhodosporidiobolus lusitaniae]